MLNNNNNNFVSTHDFNSPIFRDMKEFFENNCVVCNSLLEKYTEQWKKECEQALDCNWLVEFNYYNDNEELCCFSKTIGEVYQDWWTKYDWVPENGTFIFNLRIICNSNYRMWGLKCEEYTFETLMEDLTCCFLLNVIYPYEI